MRDKLNLENQIRAAGFTLRYVEWCEDADTPGLLGYYAGVTDWRKREVKIATHNRSERDILETLAHELHHVTDPMWDCGNRHVLWRESGEQ